LVVSFAALHRTFYRFLLWGNFFTCLGPAPGVAGGAAPILNSGWLLPAGDPNAGAPPCELVGGVLTAGAPKLNPPEEPGKPLVETAGEAGCDPNPNPPPPPRFVGCTDGEPNAKGPGAANVDGLAGAEPAFEAPLPNAKAAAVGGAVVGPPKENGLPAFWNSPPAEKLV
jgi:hypothetical protein